jgi:hypothetical protein
MAMSIDAPGAPLVPLRWEIAPTLPALHRGTACRARRGVTPFSNRNTSGLEFAVTHSKHRTAPILIATGSRIPEPQL